MLLTVTYCTGYHMPRHGLGWLVQYFLPVFMDHMIWCSCSLQCLHRWSVTSKLRCLFAHAVKQIKELLHFSNTGVTIALQ